MYLHLLCFCLASVCWVSAGEESCTFTEHLTAYDGIFKYLGLLENSNLTKHMPPFTEDNYGIKVYLALFVNSITDVDENAQTMSTQVTLNTYWNKGTDNLLWNPEDFCNITSITPQKDFFWTPDIAILESIKTEFAAAESPYVKLYFFDIIAKVDILSLTTACTMDLYRFPFDTQICSLTFESLMHSDDTIFVDLLLSDAWYQQSLHIPGEWQLLNITINTGQYEYQLTYKINIKRRPLLYIINFIFPVFCFLVLDLASFFINASAGEKLSFKVTLLLSISVLLQILNDRLASTSSDIPLIGIYCCAIFILIGVSILETILVNILIGKGEETESAIPMETRGVVNGQDDGLRDLHNSIDTVTSGNEESKCTCDTEKRASLCWTKAAKIIDVTFILLYIITVIVLLSILGKRWFLL